MRIAREEIFGPVLAVMPYRDVDQAIELANDTPYGLSGAVYTTDLDKGRGRRAPDADRSRRDQRLADRTACAVRWLG